MLGKVLHSNFKLELIFVYCTMQRRKLQIFKTIILCNVSYSMTDFYEIRKFSKMPFVHLLVPVSNVLTGLLKVILSHQVLKSIV